MKDIDEQLQQLTHSIYQRRRVVDDVWFEKWEQIALEEEEALERGRDLEVQSVLGNLSIGVTEKDEKLISDVCQKIVKRKSRGNGSRNLENVPEDDEDSCHEDSYGEDSYDEDSYGEESSYEDFFDDDGHQNVENELSHIRVQHPKSWELFCSLQVDRCRESARNSKRKTEGDWPEQEVALKRNKHVSEQASTSKEPGALINMPIDELLKPKKRIQLSLKGKSSETHMNGPRGMIRVIKSMSFSEGASKQTQNSFLEIGVRCHSTPRNETRNVKPSRLSKKGSNGFLHNDDETEVRCHTTARNETQNVKPSRLSRKVSNGFLHNDDETEVHTTPRNETQNVKPSRLSRKVSNGFLHNDDETEVHTTPRNETRNVKLSKKGSNSILPDGNESVTKCHHTSPTKIIKRNNLSHARPNESLENIPIAAEYLSPLKILCTPKHLLYSFVKVKSPRRLKDPAKPFKNKFKDHTDAAHLSSAGVEENLKNIPISFECMSPLFRASSASPKSH